LAQHIEKKIYRIIFNGFYNKVRSWIKTWALHSQIVVHIFSITSIYGRPQTFKKNWQHLQNKKKTSMYFCTITNSSSHQNSLFHWQDEQKFTRSKFPIDGLFWSLPICLLGNWFNHVSISFYFFGMSLAFLYHKVSYHCEM
jgi:hypothetical protein